MDDMEPELLEWAEDICEVCGAHVGYGVRLFHLEGVMSIRTKRTEALSTQKNQAPST